MTDFLYSLDRESSLCSNVIVSESNIGASCDGSIDSGPRKVSTLQSFPSVPVSGRARHGGTKGDLAKPDGNPSESLTQDGVHLSACLQSDQPHVGDPLGMSSEPANPDTKSSQAHGSNKYSGSPGLSQVLGTVLQQLSVSAWVPSAMLVGNIAVLLQLRADGSYNVANAVKILAGKPLGMVIILTFSLILATAITQAFEFEVIRFLEGYFDSSNSLVQAVMAARIRRHESKLRSLVCKLENAKTKAIQTAIPQMRKFPAYDPQVLDFLADSSTENNKSSNDGVSKKAGEITEAEWRLHASASALYKVDSTIARLKSYPDERRLLPTQLGNVLRAGEDSIELDEGENIEGYVIRHYDELSPALKSQHDDYRTRLDMYCCLVLVFSMLSIFSFVTLFCVNPLWGIFIAAVVYSSMAYISYRAAIATARNYGLIIQEIPQYLARQNDSAETSEPSAFEKLLDLLHRNAV